MKKLIILLVLLTFTTASYSQDINKMTYEAYLSGSMTLWKDAYSNAKAKLKRDGSSSSLYDLTLVGYGLLSATMKDQNEDIFDEYVDEVEEHAEALIERDYKTAEANAIHSGIYGFKIAYSPWKGMFYGPKSSSYIDDAIAEDPQSAVVQKLYAHYKYFTPEMWGGDREEAFNAFEKSNNKFTSQKDMGNWMFLDNLAWIGMIYRDQENKSMAIETWEQALTYEPNFPWVREALLPTVKK